MARETHDHYFKQAKREGYRSRAAYKLIQIDERKHLLRAGMRVLDCGCAPGSWLQVAAERVGPRGIVVGIDLQTVQPLQLPNSHIIEGDFTHIAAENLLQPLDQGGSARAGEQRFDIILSDMAPRTTGDRVVDHHGSARLCAAVLSRCPELLGAGGSLVMKVLEGEVYPELLQQARTLFARVKGFRPDASRRESTEMYIIAEGFHDAARAQSVTASNQRAGADADDADDDHARATPPVAQRSMPKPGAGWSSG